MLDDTSPFEVADTRGLQRVEGRAACAFKVRGSKTVLERLAQAGSFKIRLPKLPDSAAPEAVLLNTAGGLTGGDVLRFSGAVADGGHGIFTTQAAERAYRSPGGNARVVTHLTAGRGATLEWLPQETILFDGSRLERKFDVDLADDARLVAIESVIFGRAAMGEVMTSGFFRDRWRIRREGQLVHADAVSIKGEPESVIQGAATLNGGHAMSTVLYVGDDAPHRCETIRRHFDEFVPANAGASAWGGKLVCRIVAADGVGLRRAVIPVLKILRDGRDLPRVWHI